MTQTEIERALETLVDGATLERVVSALAQVCREKAEHVQTNWQDRAQAQQWDISAKRLDKAAEGIQV